MTSSRNGAPRPLSSLPEAAVDETQPISVLLADDHAVLRQGTAELLRREPDLEVVGEAADGQQAIELTQELQPDVVVMDVRMPVLSGIQATRRIRETTPRSKVLVLTAHDNDEYVFSLLKEGASGYLLKTSPAQELIAAIRLVHRGQSPLDPAIAQKLVARMSHAGSEATVPEAQSRPDSALTPRELEVLALVAQGLINRAIANQLSISDRTVQAHLTNIFAKMQVSSRVEAVLTAIRLGWLVLND